MRFKCFVIIIIIIPINNNNDVLRALTFSASHCSDLADIIKIK